jgi:hypothetical protein
MSLRLVCRSGVIVVKLFACGSGENKSENLSLEYVKKSEWQTFLGGSSDFALNPNKSELT